MVSKIIWNVHCYMEGNHCAFVSLQYISVSTVFSECKIASMSKKFNTWQCWKRSLWINFAFSNQFLIPGCKLFRHVEKYSKSTKKYFGNSWVKRLVSFWCPIERQAYGGSNLVPMTVPKTWLNILESNKKLSFIKINLMESIMNSFVSCSGIKLRFLVI